jgi:hypothetical protein
VGVHTTQFAIHDPQVGLYRPVLSSPPRRPTRGSPARRRRRARRGRAPVREGGRPGRRHAAGGLEAEVARSVGYHAGLLSLAGMGDAPTTRSCATAGA